MASKYLASGNPTFTAATRTLSGASGMSAAFATDDVGKAVVFRAGTSIYSGRVKSYVSGTSIVFEKAATLPANNVNLDDLILLDLGETKTFQSYIDEIRSKVKDDAAKLADADYQSVLAAAVHRYGVDVPHVVTVDFTATGADSYVLATILGSAYKPGSSVIRSVEYPVGDLPPTILERDSWQLYDDGTTGDGTLTRILFTDTTPKNGDTVRVMFSTELSLSITGKNYPDTEKYFQNITTLAAAYACQRLAAAYAPSTESGIALDAVEHGGKSGRYVSLAREYLARYEKAVFGSEDPVSNVKAAVSVVDLKREAEDRGGYLFHNRPR